MGEWEHPLSPNLGGPAGGDDVPAVDYLSWYLPRLDSGIEHDLSQSGFAVPWDWDELSGGEFPDNLTNPFTDVPLDPRTWIAEREGVSVEQVACGHGVSQCLLFALLPLLDGKKPRKIAVEMPSYGPVAQFGRILGYEVVPFWRGPASDGDCGPWKIDRPCLEKLLPEVSALVTTPVQNPSGWMMTADDQRWLAEICAEHGVGIVSDEVYLDSTRESEHFRPMHRFGEHCISVNSVTKIYGLGNLRFGWLIGSPEKAVIALKAMHNMQGMLSTPALRLTELAQPHFQMAHDLMAQRRETNLPLLENTLKTHGIEWLAPPTGIFGCVHLPNGWSGQKAIEEVAEPLGLLAIPCAMFSPQLDNYIRVAWGSEPASFSLALDKFNQFLHHLRTNEP